MGALMSNSFASDGFMLNLGSVLLRLCSPFTSGVKNPRLLKIDVTYSAAEAVVSEDAKLMGVHCRAVKEETCVCTARYVTSICCVFNGVLLIISF